MTGIAPGSSRGRFKAGFITGAGVSEASLGWADVGVMSYEENLRVCRAIVGCFDLPSLTPTPAMAMR
jgi:2-methylisocitrate lyase-like PEP mutase family enzyme